MSDAEGKREDIKIDVHAHQCEFGLDNEGQLHVTMKICATPPHGAPVSFTSGGTLTLASILKDMNWAKTSKECTDALIAAAEKAKRTRSEYAAEAAEPEKA